MFLETGWAAVPIDGATCAAYRVKPLPGAERLPGILVIQEIWGVDEHIRDVTERLARAGYLVLAPDLYAWGERPPELAPERIQGAKRFLDTIPPQQWGDREARARALGALPAAEREQTAATLDGLFEARDEEWQTPLLDRMLAQLREDEYCDGRVACVGFCMGGTLAGRLASRAPGPDGAAVFYGMPPSAEEIKSIVCPFLGLYGAEDARVGAAIPAFIEAMVESGKDFEYHVYPGAPHAFFNDTRRSYRSAAARDAWARCLSFFARVLAPETWSAV